MAAPAPPPPAPAAPPVLPAPVPQSFLTTLSKNPNVSMACIAGVNQVLSNTLLARQAEFFSGRVGEALNLLLPPVLQDIAFAKDKRQGMGHFVYQVPLWSLGVPDSCGYIGLNYCQIDAVPVMAKWGVCVPKECGIEDVMTAIFPPVTKKLAERIKGRCGPLNADKALFFTVEPLSAGAWATLTVLLVLLLTVLGATVIDTYGDDWNLPSFFKNEKFRRLVDGFSLPRTYKRLMAPPRQSPFACLDAVRTLSMLMVLFGHSLYFLLTINGVSNPREAMGFYGRGFLATGPGMIGVGCLLSVDSFLALAGFLGVLLFTKELRKRLHKTTDSTTTTSSSTLTTNKTRVTLTHTLQISKMALVSYLRRYLRLTPAYALLLAIFTTLAPLMASAPPSPTDLTHETRQCQIKWWQNILYVNNIFSNIYNMCYNPSWFLAAVQQLFLLVPLISAVAFFRPRLGLGVCLLLCVASWIYTFENAQDEGWRINSLDRPGFPLFFMHFYTRTFTRMPTFIIGGMAAILYDYQGERFRSFLNRGRSQMKVWGILTVALVLLAAVMFGTKPEIAYAPGKWSQTTSSLYITLSFSAWITALCVVCGVVAMGKGGPLKTFLELPFWVITSRLTYSTYLVHPMVIMTVNASRGGHPFHFSMLSLFNEFLGYATLSGFSAVVFHFLAEAPFGELERFLFSGMVGDNKSGGNKKKITTVDDGESDTKIVDGGINKGGMNVIVPVAEVSEEMEVQQ